jgi:hypothetical protein
MRHFQPSLVNGSSKVKMSQRKFSLPDFCNYFTEEKVRSLLERPEIERKCMRNGKSLLIESINRMIFEKTENYLAWDSATFLNSKFVYIKDKTGELLEVHSWTAYQKWVIFSFCEDFPLTITVKKEELEGKSVRTKFNLRLYESVF